jgi:hypothetical protein
MLYFFLFLHSSLGGRIPIVTGCETMPCGRQAAKLAEIGLQKAVNYFNLYKIKNYEKYF